MKSKENKKYLIIDFNQLLYSTLFSIRKFEDEDDILEWVGVKRKLRTEVFQNEFRTYFWNKIMGITNHFDRPDEVILCHDNSSWRKKYFPYYKAKRKDTKKYDEFDWDSFYKLARNFQTNEIDKYSPYIDIDCEDCEGDDIIAILTDKFAENPENEIIIYSNDKDFVQLLKHKNVKLFSEMKNEYVKSTNPKNDLLELILIGDTADGIPNVYNRDDAFVNPEYDDNGKKKRQKGLGSVTARKAIVENRVLDDILKTPEIQKNFERNQMLIDFEKIPAEIRERVIEEYTYQKSVVKSPAEFQRYLAREGLGMVASSLNKIVYLY